ncbi:MAG: 4-hydroxy-tetrahydrodipicolinate synthase, partial [Firmicutes bacterium]|nr:4-hydroxy-tetrahydrodipicolinate synthase [Bacillota bacterium]
MTLFEGAATALITPFRDGKIDYVSMGKLVEWQIAQGIDALVVCGTTGEASTLSVREKLDLIKFVADLTSGRVPVIAGTGGNCTESALELSKEAEKTGADGLLIITPYYNKCSETGLITHFQTIADAVNLPVIMYSVPSRTGVNMGPEAVRILKEHPNIVGLKEASGNISQICQLAAHIDDDFTIYSGNDDQTVPILSLGGKGCISTVSNIIPGRVSRMIHSWLDGEVTWAGSEQIALKPLIDAVFTE